MAMKITNSLNATIPYFSNRKIILNEEIEEVVSDPFDPEAGKASDNPFANLDMEDAPEESAASNNKEVSKYVAGEEE